jgi:hypothetical protein
MIRKLATLAAAAALASGCTLMNKPEKVAPWENAENWCYALSDLAVEWLASCEPMTPAYQDFYYRMYTEGFLDCATVQDRVDAGALRYDADQGKACLEQADSVDCWGEPTACDAALTGNVGPGGACTSEMECRSDTQGCDTSMTCPGTCRPLSDVSESCYGQSDCLPGLYCDFNYLPNTCQPRLSAWATCASGDPPERCADGYFCGFDGAQRCIPRPGPGQGCNPTTAPCAEGMGIWCDVTTCVAIPTAPSPIGGRCDGLYYCDPATAWCDGAIGCKARQPRDQGYECTSRDQCLAPANCNTHPLETVSTCKSIPGLGQGCIGGMGECLAGGYCEASSGFPGVCVSLPTLGGRCNLPGVADSTSWCLEGWCNTTVTPGTETCVPYGGVGATCNLAGTPPCDGMAGLTCDLGTNRCIEVACGGVP